MPAVIYSFYIIKEESHWLSGQTHDSVYKGRGQLNVLLLHAYFTCLMAYLPFLPSGLEFQLLLGINIQEMHMMKASFVPFYGNGRNALEENSTIIFQIEHHF